MRAFEEILKVLNEDAMPPFRFTSKNIILGEPIVSEDPIHNTKISVTGIPLKGYTSTKDVLYKRILLNSAIALDGEEPVIIRSRNKPSKSVLLDSINAIFNLYLTAADIEDFQLPDFETGLETDVTLVTKPLSLAWVGSVTFTLIYGRPFLDAVVSKRNLSFQTHPTSNLRVLSTRLALWNVDATCLGDAKDIISGRFKNPTAVNDFLAYYGIINSSSSAWKDDLTINVPEANTEFDRVVIARVNPSNSSGYIYLHYNTLED